MNLDRAVPPAPIGSPANAEPAEGHAHLLRVATILAEIGRATSLESALAALGRGAITLLGGAQAAVRAYRVDERGTNLAYWVSPDGALTPAGVPDPPPTSIAGQLLAGGPPRIVPDLWALDPADSPLYAELRQRGLRSSVAVPIVAGSERIGSLHVDHPTPGYYTELHLALAEALAIQAGAAIERARAGDRRAAEARLRALYEDARDQTESHVALNASLRELAEARDAALAEANAERQRLRALFNDAPALIALTRGRDHVFELANAAFMRMVGIRNVVGLPARRALPELEPQRIFERLDRAYDTGQMQTIPELAVGIDRNGDGRIDDDERVVVSAVYQPYRDADGNVAGLLIHAVEVTEQVRARAALAESEARLRLALRASGMGIWDWDVRSGVITWTEKVAELHGLAPGAYDGTFDAWAARLHPDDRDRVLERVEQALRERTWYEVEFRVVWPDGTIRWLATQGQAMYDDAGTPLRMVGATYDVTARRLP